MPTTVQETAERDTATAAEAGDSGTKAAKA